jgi:hypothetical protein
VCGKLKLEALTIGILKAAVRSQRPNLLTSAPYGALPYLKSMNGNGIISLDVISKFTAQSADFCVLASEILLARDFLCSIGAMD